ncbi:polysaccharide deacetylase family protein [Plantactinospora sp. GCM10030261]|uniref:polysaccharide deacetylase family protein n=1 Tax=Plantactinospora sp. GCM10030261 TaxID=3273420 RepID=UPI003616ABB0
MRFTPAARLLVLVVVLATGVLSGVYAIGRVVGTETALPDDPGVEPTRASPSASQSTNPDRREEGLPPLPADVDGPFGARLTTGTSQVALTFDDGPDPAYTPQILAILRAHRVKATFCMVGENAAAHPELVRAVAAEGHTLCNHSWNHDVLLGHRNPAVIQADLLRTDTAIRAAAPGVPVRLFRQPGGNWTPAVVAVARTMGMTSVHWDVDPRDWTLPGASVVYGRVLLNVTPGSIVLLHDGGGDRQGTADALAEMLPELLGRYQLGALPTRYSPSVYAAARAAMSPVTPR